MDSLVPPLVQHRTLLQERLAGQHIDDVDQIPPATTNWSTPMTQLLTTLLATHERRLHDRRRPPPIRSTLIPPHSHIHSLSPSVDEINPPVEYLDLRYLRRMACAVPYNHATLTATAPGLAGRTIGPATYRGRRRTPPAHPRFHPRRRAAAATLVS